MNLPNATPPLLRAKHYARPLVFLPENPSAAASFAKWEDPLEEMNREHQLASP